MSAWIRWTEKIPGSRVLRRLALFGQARRRFNDRDFELLKGFFNNVLDPPYPPQSRRGFIDASGLAKIAQRIGCAVPRDETEEMIEEADFSGTGKIGLAEFLAIMDRPNNALSRGWARIQYATAISDERRESEPSVPDCKPCADHLQPAPPEFRDGERDACCAPGAGVCLIS